jgi:hypothetical protein
VFLSRAKNFLSPLLGVFVTAGNPSISPPPWSLIPPPAHLE